jgi:hypothetical protein
MPCPVCNHADEDHRPRCRRASSLTRRHNAGTPGYRFEILFTVVVCFCACPPEHDRPSGPSLAQPAVGASAVRAKPSQAMIRKRACLTAN